MGALIDVKKVQQEAQKEFREEREIDAKKRLKSQMKVVEDCRAALMNEERKLQDLMTAIAEGN